MEARQKVVSEIFYNIIRWKKRLEYYIGEGAKPGNIYKLISLICFGAKPITKNLKNLMVLKYINQTKKRNCS
jgi:16S rRNA (cytosine967-C5)-methyltransferase